MDRLFDPTNPEHQRRRNNTFEDASGEIRLGDQFDTILAKVMISPEAASLLLNLYIRMFRSLRKKSFEGPTV